MLLSPAGARVVTTADRDVFVSEWGCCPPQGRELLRDRHCNAAYPGVPLLSPAGARVVTLCLTRRNSHVSWLLSPAGARVVTSIHHRRCILLSVAVPRRGASCYGKNAENTMRIFRIPTIFLYYLLYFCVSIRDIVGFLRCEPACNNLIYCYYTTRFAPNQPLLHIGSVRLHS